MKTKPEIYTLAGLQKCFFRHTPLILFLMVIFALFSGAVVGQSTTGFSGYFSIPTAELSPDKSVNIGYNQLNRKYYGFYEGKHDLDVGFIDIGFLPIMEVGIRITRPRGFQTENKTTWDRMIASRILPVKETKYFPAVAVGFQGFFTTGKDGGANYFNSTYIVASKNFTTGWFINKFGLSLGYGSDILKASSYQFIGVFGGFKFSPKNMDNLELMVEYDTDKWNVGARIICFKHIILLAGFEGLDSFSGGVSYRFLLP